MNGAMEYFRHIMEVVGTSVDGVGVFIVAVGMVVATVRLATHRSHDTGNYIRFTGRMWGARFYSVSSFSLLATSSGPLLSHPPSKT